MQQLRDLNRNNQIFTTKSIYARGQTEGEMWDLEADGKFDIRQTKV